MDAHRSGVAVGKGQTEGKRIFVIVGNGNGLSIKIQGDLLMLKVTVCIGSSCHIKGSRQVVEDLQRLIATEKLEDKVELGGTFCMGRCQEGVCVTIDDDFFSVSPETTAEFFEKEILTRV